MRRYVVVRTDRRRKELFFNEIGDGRLRQGWGWPGCDLRELRRKLSERKRLDEGEVSAWRNRRLLDTEADGLKPGDIVIVPNLPRDGHWVIARVSGPYRFEPINSDGGMDYGHIVPVTPVRDNSGRIAVVDPDNEHVDARLRATMRNMSRMWSVDGLGAAIDKLITAIESGADTVSIQPDEKKRLGFIEQIRQAAWDALAKRYKAAELERLVEWLLARIYPQSRVEHWGGRSERGADLIVFTPPDALGLEYKIAVQVKMYDGIADDVRSLDQIREARDAHRVDAGVVVTTATEVSDAYEKRREQLEAELGIDIRVVARDELLDLVMRNLDAGIDVESSTTT